MEIGKEIFKVYNDLFNPAFDKIKKNLPKKQSQLKEFINGIKGKYNKLKKNLYNNRRLIAF